MPSKSPMKVPMSPRNISLPDSDDDDAPEAIGQGDAKATVTGHERVVKEFQAITAQKRKEANRARDKARKAAAVEKREQVLISKRTRKRPASSHSDDEDEHSDSGSNEIEKRMARAMRQAAEEMDEDDASEDDASHSAPGSSDVGMSEPLDEAPSDGEDERNERVSPVNEPAPSQKRKRKSNKKPTTEVMEPAPKPPVSRPKPPRLPDEVFAAAAAALARAPTKVVNAGIQKRTNGKSEHGRKRRQKATNGPKDLVVGSRIVRTLRASSHPTPTAPTVAVKAFQKRSLKAKKGRWERRPANLTVSSVTGGPVVGFARGK